MTSTRRHVEHFQHWLGASVVLVIAGCGGITTSRGGNGDVGSGNGGTSSSTGGKPNDTGGTTGTGDATSTPPSCVGLPLNCGPSSNESCCTSPLVTGGTFYRSYDGVTTFPDYTSKAYPATVSDFLLDKYEITVGRFRKFVAAYSQNMIAAGAGKNPNNASDPGWDVTWNASLPADATGLTSSYVRCDTMMQTWTPSAGANENKPINCIDWYEANAFCIWDGGRLPTETEWNYAAAGGTDQRVYPWGATAPGANAALAVYGCYYNRAPLRAGGSCSGANIAPVGSVSAGNGKYGQADLAGNVREWMLDWWTPPDSTLCTDCAVTAAGDNRVDRGGSFNWGAEALLSSSRNYEAPTELNVNSPTWPPESLGSRCARTP
jgi:sulfatase modifying factor 1